jgi:hypothetical protein
MNLSEAIREALAELGTDATTSAIRDLIHTRHRRLREKLDTPTFSSTLSVLRKKAAEAEEPSSTKNESVAAPTFQPSIARKSSPAIADERTPEETAIVGFRETYKHLVSLVGSDLANSIVSRLTNMR